MILNLEFYKLFEKDPVLFQDLTGFIFGDLIGEGNFRVVYQFMPCKNYVIKLDKGGRFDNVTEWEIYQNLKEDPLIGKWLCPCIKISDCGRFLIQVRTKPITLEEMPKEIPNCFTDLKIQNWGKIGKQIVCHDYGNHRFYSPENFKMVKANWSDENKAFMEVPGYRPITEK